MTVVELAATNYAPFLANDGIPGVYRAFPAYSHYDQFWTDTFGAPDDSVSERKKIISFFSNADTRYQKAASLIDCVGQQGSFFWDQINQILYVNYDDGDNNFDLLQVFTAAIGFSDSTSVQYFDDVEYLPMLTKAPQYAKQVDYLTYGELALVSGSLTIANGDGSAGKQAVLDYLIGANIYGNEVFIKYGNEGDDYGDLVAVSAFSVKDYSFTLDSMTIRLIDLRTSQNVEIPQAVYSSDDYADLSDDDEGKVIPLIYGSVRNAPCLCVDKARTSGTTRRYRAGLLLTALASVEVNIDGMWTARTPQNIDLAVGEFDVPLSVNDSFAPYECRAVCTGIENTGVHDVIIDLNERYIGVVYNNTNYYTAEVSSESVSFEPIGVIFSEKKKLFSAIADLQGKSNIGFFYDIDGLGRRTIRVDNPNRDRAAYVQFCEIQNQDELEVVTDSSDVYGAVSVSYDKNWQADSARTERNSEYLDSVRVKYRSKKELAVDSFLSTQALAAIRAAVDGETYSDIRPTAELELAGKDFFALRTTDIIEVELTPGFVDADTETLSGRTYFGVVRGQITSVRPDYGKGVVKVGTRIRPYSDLFDDLITQTTDWELADGELFELETDDPYPDYYQVIKE